MNLFGRPPEPQSEPMDEIRPQEEAPAHHSSRQTRGEGGRWGGFAPDGTPVEEAGGFLSHSQARRAYVAKNKSPGNDVPRAVNPENIMRAADALREGKMSTNEIFQKYGALDPILSPVHRRDAAEFRDQGGRAVGYSASPRPDRLDNLTATGKSLFNRTDVNRPVIEKPMWDVLSDPNNQAAMGTNLPGTFVFEKTHQKGMDKGKGMETGATDSGLGFDGSKWLMNILGKSQDEIATKSGHETMHMLAHDATMSEKGRGIFDVPGDPILSRLYDHGEPIPGGLEHTYFEALRRAAEARGDHDLHDSIVSLQKSSARSTGYQYSPHEYLASMSEILDRMSPYARTKFDLSGTDPYLGNVIKGHDIGDRALHRLLSPLEQEHVLKRMKEDPSIGGASGFVGELQGMPDLRPLDR